MQTFLFPCLSLVLGARPLLSCSVQSASHSACPRHPTAARSASRYDWAAAWVKGLGDRASSSSTRWRGGHSLPLDHLLQPRLLRASAATAAGAAPAAVCWQVLLAHHACCCDCVLLHPAITWPDPTTPAVFVLLYLCCCVQLAWPDHKSVHKQAAAAAAAAWLYCTKRGKGRSALMPNFDWTGPLRPAPIGPPRQVRIPSPTNNYEASGPTFTARDPSDQHQCDPQHRCVFQPTCVPPHTCVGACAMMLRLH
jgi:hypothetical protein